MSQLTTKVCPICGIEYAAPEVFFKAKSDGVQGASRGWYCPNGHNLVFTEREVDRLARERDNLKQQMARVEDEKRAAERQAAAARAETARIKKRVGAGTCPCCKRTFANMARHMKTKHPEILPFKKTA